MRGLASFRDRQPFVYGRFDRERWATRRYPFARAGASLAVGDDISPVAGFAMGESEQPIVCPPDDGSARDLALGAELGFGHLDPKRFVDLARGMGIPGRDAARQVLGLVTERGRVQVPDAAGHGSVQWRHRQPCTPVLRSSKNMLSPHPYP